MPFFFHEKTDRTWKYSKSAMFGQLLGANWDPEEKGVSYNTWYQTSERSQIQREGSLKEKEGTVAVIHSDLICPASQPAQVAS